MHVVTKDIDASILQTRQIHVKQLQSKILSGVVSNKNELHPHEQLHLDAQTTLFYLK